MVYLIVALVMTSVVMLVYSVATLAPARSRAIGRRLDELESGASRHYALQRRRRQEKRERLESLLEAFGEKVSTKKVDWSEIQKMLVQAGYRRPAAVSVYVALRFTTVAAFAAAGFLGATMTGAAPPIIVLASAGAALGGWILPRYWVKRKTRKRQTELQKALADALDLLVVCVEAGLGLNQALVRVSEEIEHVSETMAQELILTNLEIRAGTPRDEALRNLGERTGVGDLKALTAMLIQTDRFGTSIATALRVHAETHQAPPARRGGGRQDDDQARVPAGPVHLPGHVRGHPGARHPAHPGADEGPGMKRVRVVNETRGRVLGERVELADSWWARLRGLIGSDPLESGRGAGAVPRGPHVRGHVSDRRHLRRPRRRGGGDLSRPGAGDPIEVAR